MCQPGVAVLIRAAAFAAWRGMPNVSVERECGLIVPFDAERLHQLRASILLSVDLVIR
jgi:hypothetical protein